jgi:hypothetical protein
MLTLMVEGVDGFFQYLQGQSTTQNQNIFFREKYLYLLPSFIENASMHVYTFFCVLSIST